MNGGDESGDGGSAPSPRVICAGHEELRTVVIETKMEVKHLSEQFEKFLQTYDLNISKQSDRIHYLEMYGAKISQENAKGLVVLEKRTDALEGFRDQHEGERAGSRWIAALISGIIALVVSVLTIVVMMWPRGGGN